MKTPRRAKRVRSVARDTLPLQESRTFRERMIRERSARLARDLGPDVVIRAQFLAHEVVITELFVNRLRKSTRRPIVVIPLGRTGAAYTWSLAVNKELSEKNIHMGAFPYSSTEMTQYKVNAFRSYMHNFSSLVRPLFVFVDSSRAKRMPGSFVGNQSGIHSSFSLKTTLEEQGLRTVLVGYNWSMGRTKLSSGAYTKGVKLPHIDMGSTPTRPGLGLTVDAILLNPSRERSITKRYKSEKERWRAAPHDDTDFVENEEFRQLVVDLAARRKGNTKATFKF